MRVLFLDVDGVLHPASAGMAQATGEPEVGMFRERQMACLAQVLRATGAHVVLSSTWRLRPGGPEAVSSALRRWDLAPVFDCTPAEGAFRADQIWSWLAQHGCSVEGYAVVDDSDLSCIPGRGGVLEVSPIGRHCVRTPSGTGLSAAHVRRLITKLLQVPDLPATAAGSRLKAGPGGAAAAPAAAVAAPGVRLPRLAPQGLGRMCGAEAGALRKGRPGQLLAPKQDGSDLSRARRRGGG